MKLFRVEGPAIILHCIACAYEGIGGSEAYPSAASGKMREPEKWYQSEDGVVVYCAECAAKMATSDPTRSVNQFYNDTAGEVICKSILGLETNG